MEQARKRLAIVWLALIALLALTVAGSFTVTGASSAIVSFGVAAAKVALIFWFFMQLRTEKGLIRVFAVGAIAWLLILLLFAAIDYATR
ncbi:MAG TPA: cytochrome C oxidase subunit IV family protein [Reyranella sp.]|nr:cytochrome C oxidase subunit IV family protein [Reyranella sp.]